MMFCIRLECAFATQVEYISKLLNCKDLTYLAALKMYVQVQFYVIIQFELSGFNQVSLKFSQVLNFLRLNVGRSVCCCEMFTKVSIEN